MSRAKAAWPVINLFLVMLSLASYLAVACTTHQVCRKTTHQGQQTCEVQQGGVTRYVPYRVWENGGEYDGTRYKPGGGGADGVHPVFEDPVHPEIPVIHGGD